MLDAEAEYERARQRIRTAKRYIEVIAFVLVVLMVVGVGGVIGWLIGKVGG